MAHTYGTGSGVTDMKINKHILIKTGLVILLVIYLTALYSSDNARNIPMDQIAQSMEKDQAIIALNKETRADLKRYYQTEERDIDGFFFYKASSPMAVEEICIMKAKDRAQAQILLENAQAHLSSQKNVFEGYGTDQMALLNNAAVGKKETMYIICVEPMPIAGSMHFYP